jgi:hypothetical protein
VKTLRVPPSIRWEYIAAMKFMEETHAPDEPTPWVVGFRAPIEEDTG